MAGSRDQPITGARETVVVGTRALALLYFLLVPGYVVVLDGAERVVMVTVSVLTGLGAVAAARLMGAAGDGMASRLLWFVCVAPLVNSLMRLAVTRQIEQTAVVMLAVVAVGAVAAHRRQVIGLTLGGCAAWAVIVLVRHPAPMEHAPNYAAQLGLACGLSAAVFSIRRLVDRRLKVSLRLLRTQVVDLTELRAELERSLHQFRDVFDHSPVGIGLVDEHRRFVQANPALCRLLGRSPGEVLGHRSAEFTHPDDLAVHHDTPRRLRDSPDGVVRVEKRYVRPDAEVRWAWLTSALVDGPAGESWTLAHMQDVTERELAGQALATAQESVRAAAEIARASQLGGDPRPLVLEHLQRLTNATSVTLVEAVDEQRLRVTAAAGQPDLVGIEILLGDRSATSHVWRTGEPLFVSQMADHPLANKALIEKSQASSMLWQPVGQDGQLLAVLALVWSQAVPEISVAQRAAVQALGAELGAALTGEAMRLRLEELSVTDALTGLLNRRGWDDHSALMHKQAERMGLPLTVALVDMDHFKQYNDTHGHQAGDELLQQVSRRARAELRDVDVIARWGGEELAVILHDCDAASAGRILDRLRCIVPSSATCSVGYAQLLPGESVDAGLGRADSALYLAKEAGRDRIREASPPRARHASAAAH